MHGQCRAHGKNHMNLNASDYFYDSTDGLRLYCRIYPRATIGRLVGALSAGSDTKQPRLRLRLPRTCTPQREVFAADLRGRGRSAWDPDPSHYQMPTYVEDVWSLLDHAPWTG